jgi:hypothetical protein
MLSFDSKKIMIGFARNTVFHYDYNKHGRTKIIKGDLHLTVSDRFFESNFSILAADDVRQPKNSNSRKRG